MRKIFLFMMVSVDGYFEGPGHDLSWHNVDAEFEYFANQQLRESDMLIFGHKTYEMMSDFWSTSKGQVSPETAKLMNEASKIVISHKSFKADWENTRVIDKNIFEEIRKLKDQPGKEIAILGSNNLCVSLMQEGLVDELRIMTNPVVIGEGTALFSGLSKELKLKLLQTREFKSGNVLNCYLL